MSSLALLMFNNNEGDAIVRNVQALRNAVDEIVIIDSSSPHEAAELAEALRPYYARVVRAIPLGYGDALRGFGVTKVRSDYAFILDADEEASPQLVADLRRLTEFDAYVIPRYEVGLDSYTYHLRLLRPGAVNYRGRSFDFPEVAGRIGHLSQSHRIIHHADYRNFLVEKQRAERYLFVENVERPFTGEYLSNALTIRLAEKTFALPVPAGIRIRANDPLSDGVLGFAVATEFVRDLLLGKGLAAARFNRRYALVKRRYAEELADSALIQEIANEVHDVGGILEYLRLNEPAYIERLTTSFAWNRPGIDVYKELLFYRHLHGRSKPSLEPEPTGPPTDSTVRLESGLQQLVSKVESSLTVVIPTHERPEKLRALLSSLREARIPQIKQIVVVDDSESPSPISEEFPDLPVEVVQLPRRVFLSRAKNIGWRHSSSEFVYFIDDDNRVTRETILAPFETMLANPDIGAITPAVLYSARPDLVWVYATPLARSRWSHVLVGRNRTRDPTLEGRLRDTDALPNASLVRKRALEDIDGFREDMLASSSADAATRLRRAGWRVCAHTGAFIYHDVEPPGVVGYWASHGIADPERVYYDAQDWFLLMKVLHRDEPLFTPRAIYHALGFAIPNSMAYLMRGGSRGRRAFAKLLRGGLQGLRLASREQRNVH